MTNKPKKTAKAKEPTQAQKVSQLQTAVILLFNLSERVIRMAEKMVASDEKGADIMSLQSVLNKEQSAMNKHLQARCNSLNNGLMFCIMLINVIAVISVMRETGIGSMYTIVTGALTLGVWVGYYGTLLFCWLRKNWFYRKYKQSGATLAEATDALAQCAKAGAKSLDALAGVAEKTKANADENLASSVAKQKEYHPACEVLQKVMDVCEEHKMTLGTANAGFYHVDMLNGRMSNLAYFEISIGTGAVGLDEFFKSIVPTFWQKGLTVKEINAEGSEHGFQATMKVS